jgi:hypothetical protein
LFRIRDINLLLKANADGFGPDLVLGPGKPPNQSHSVK